MSAGTGKPEYRVEKCKACESEIRLPTNVKDTAKIQCPLCQSTFRISDVTGPPVATIITEEEEAVGVEIESVPVVDRVVSDGDQGMDAIVPAPSYATTTATGRAKAQGIQIDSTDRKQKARKSGSKSSKRAFVKKRSKASDFLKFVLGAVLAVPVAQLVLWWLFAQDPLGIAPTVGKYVPFIVPAKVLPAESRDIEPTTRNSDPDAPNSFRVINKPKKFDTRPALQKEMEKDKPGFN